MDEYFKYNTAIVRKVAKSLPEEAQRQSPESSPVDWENTIKQHDNYVNILRNEIGLKVVELPADEELPDCVFVEDVAVVIGNKALVTTPGHKSRQGETDAMRKCLHDLGLNLTIMKDMDSEALLDGGDVLFTGQEIMVGVSSRTNRSACAVLAQTFPEFPVTPIEIKSGLHLKSFCSLVSPGVILLSKKTAEIQKMGENIKLLAKKKYQFLEVDDEGVSANCLYIISEKLGPSIVHPPLEKYPDSKKAYKSLSGVRLFSCDCSELAKVDGALTCCSILLTI